MSAIWSLKQDEEQSRCSLYFYGDIVSATWESMWYEEDRCPQDIADFLNQLDGYEDIDIYFNSGGGDVFAGLAIYNQFKTIRRTQSRICRRNGSIYRISHHVRM